MPDLIVVYGVDQLFDVKGLSKKGVAARLKRLRRLVDTYSARCAQTGTTIWFGRSLDFHAADPSPMMQGVNEWLYKQCQFGLAVDPQLPGVDTRTCAGYRDQTNAALPSI